MRMTKDDTWKFLEEMVEKTLHWEGLNKKVSTTTPTTKGGVHSIVNFIAAEAKIAALMRIIEVLEIKRIPS